MAARFLAAEMPEFNAEFAPGATPAKNPELDDAAENEPLLPSATPGLMTGKPPATPVGAPDKPSTLQEAFQSLDFPEDLQEPLLNLVGAELSSDASILAALPFDEFREAVAKDLVLNDGESPTLFQKGREGSSNSSRI